MDACSLPQATCHLTIVPSWFCSWREVDLRSLKGNPDEENEEVMAWSLSLRERVHMWVQTSRCLRPVDVKCKLLVLLFRLGRAPYGVGQRGSVKLLCCRSRTYLMPPLPPCMPNVRRWRGPGGCGPQVCRPSGGAAGDGAGGWGPHVRGRALPLSCSLCSWHWQWLRVWSPSCLLGLRRV